MNRAQSRPTIVLLAHSSPLGMTVAKHLIAGGLAVTLPLPNEEAVDHARDELGSFAAPLLGDLHQPETLSAAFRVAEANLGPVMGICHIVPRVPRSLRETPYAKLSWTAWQETARLLLEPVLLAHQAAVAFWQGKQTGGVIIDVLFHDAVPTQPTQVRGEPLAQAITASVEALNRAVGTGWQQRGIRSNLIIVHHPAPLAVSEGQPDTGIAIADLAGAILFLLSPTGRHLTGQRIELAPPVSVSSQPSAPSEPTGPAVRAQRPSPQPTSSSTVNIWRTLGRVWGKVKAQQQKGT